jgi:hypothetical protein
LRNPSTPHFWHLTADIRGDAGAQQKTCKAKSEDKRNLFHFVPANMIGKERPPISHVPINPGGQANLQTSLTIDPSTTRRIRASQCRVWQQSAEGLDVRTDVFREDGLHLLVAASKSKFFAPSSRHLTWPVWFESPAIHIFGSFLKVLLRAYRLALRRALPAP